MKQRSKNWQNEYRGLREALAPWVSVSKVFPRKAHPTYNDVRRMRRYVERLGAIVSQPSSVVVSKSAGVRDELKRSFPQPRLRGLRGVIVPSHSPQEKVKARRVKGRGVELVYESKVGAMRRRFVRVPDSLLLDRDGRAVRALIADSWDEAESDGYTVAFLTFQHGKDSSLDGLLGDEEGRERLLDKAVEIATAQGNYRDPEKWFRGVAYLKEAGTRRAPRRAGEMKRIRSRKSAAKKRSKTRANLLLKG